MALTADQVSTLNKMCPGANKALLGDTISALQAGSGITYGVAGAMAAVGVAAANAAGTATTPARIDHVHAMNAAAVITALAGAATDVAINTHKLTGVSAGTAGTDAVNKTQLDAVAAGGINVVKRTATFAFGDFAAVAAHASAALPIGLILPGNARIVGVEAILTQSFTDGAGCTATVDIGGTDPVSLVVAESIVVANSGNFPMGLFGAGPGGAGQFTTPGTKAYPFASYTAQQLSATFKSNVNLNTWNAGNITINVFYVIAA